MMCLKEYCPVCDGGEVGVLRCSGEARLVLMCEECDGVWLSYQDFVLGNFAVVDESEGLVIEGTKSSLRFPGARWATKDEVSEGGWGLVAVIEVER
jgi:hypothetical protein